MTEFNVYRTGGAWNGRMVGKFSALNEEGAIQAYITSLGFASVTDLAEVIGVSPADFFAQLKIERAND